MNDTVFVMANGVDGAEAKDVESLATFEKGLTLVCRELTMSITERL